MTSILVVDDHPLLAQGLAYALRGEGFDVHVTSEPDGELVRALAVVHRPVLALVDLQFDGVTKGLELIPALVDLTPVVVLTGVEDLSLLGACLEAGAAGVARKTEPFARLLERVLAATRGEAVNSLREREDLLAARSTDRRHTAERWSAFESLSPRESEVLELLASGHTADEIAGRIHVSLATVRTHIQAILRKLGVSNQLAAVARVRETGWSLDAVLSRAG